MCRTQIYQQNMQEKDFFENFPYPYKSKCSFRSFDPSYLTSTCTVTKFRFGPKRMDVPF
jgi:hypothetical protein